MMCLMLLSTSDSNYDDVDDIICMHVALYDVLLSLIFLSYVHAESTDTRCSFYMCIHCGYCSHNVFDYAFSFVPRNLA